jgi:hypothetical protein
VVLRVSGVLARLRCWPSNTKKLAGAIKIESPSEKPEGLDRPKVENQKW